MGTNLISANSLHGTTFKGSNEYCNWITFYRNFYIYQQIFQILSLKSVVPTFVQSRLAILGQFSSKRSRRMWRTFMNHHRRGSEAYILELFLSRFMCIPLYVRTLMLLGFWDGVDASLPAPHQSTTATCWLDHCREFRCSRKKRSSTGGFPWNLKKCKNMKGGFAFLARTGPYHSMWAVIGNNNIFQGNVTTEVENVLLLKNDPSLVSCSHMFPVDEST